MRIESSQSAASPGKSIALRPQATRSLLPYQKGVQASAATNSQKMIRSTSAFPHAASRSRAAGMESMSAELARTWLELETFGDITVGQPHVHEHAKCDATAHRVKGQLSP